MTRPSRRGDERALLRQRPFRLLWTGQALSAVGDRLIIVALPLLVASLTRSAGSVGLVIACQGLALLVGLPVGGVIADRLPRQRVMLAADLVRAGVHAGLAVLVLAGAANLPLLIGAEVLFGLAQGAFQPAYAGLIPQTVAREQIQAATALTQASQYAAMLVGPAVAAALAVAGGLGIAFAVDAATFLASAALLARLRPARGAPIRRGAGLRAEGLAALAIVRARRWVWTTIGAFSLVVMLTVAPYTVLGPFIAARAYGDAASFGLIAAMVGAGTLGGALLAMRWRPERAVAAGAVAASAWPLAMVALALAAPLALVGIAALLAGGGLALFSVWWETALAERIPGDALSRVAALDWMGSLALLPFGCLLAAASSSVVGDGPTLLLGAAVALGALAWCAAGARGMASEADRGREAPEAPRAVDWSSPVARPSA